MYILFVFKMYQSNTFIFFYTQVQSTDAKKWGKEAVDLTNQLIEADVLIADGVIGQSENHPQKKVITIKGPKKMRAPQRLQLKNLNAKKRTTAKKNKLKMILKMLLSTNTLRAAKRSKSGIRIRWKVWD